MFVVTLPFVFVCVCVCIRVCACVFLCMYIYILLCISLHAKCIRREEVKYEQAIEKACIAYAIES